MSTSLITATARHESGSPTITRDTIERATAQAARAAAERAALEAMGLSPVGARLFQELRRHDWGHDDSDDDARVVRGRVQAKELRRLYLACDRDEADRVWQALAPDGVAPPPRPPRPDAILEPCLPSPEFLSAEPESYWDDVGVPGQGIVVLNSDGSGSGVATCDDTSA